MREMLVLRFSLFFFFSALMNATDMTGSIRTDGDASSKKTRRAAEEV